MKNRLLAARPFALPALALPALALPALGWAHGTGGVPHSHGDTLAWAALAGATGLCWGLYRSVQWLAARRQASRR